MRKPKRKLTPQQRKRRRETMIIFVNGKQKRVPRPPTINGMDVDDFIRANADPIWLHQEGLWEYMDDHLNAITQTPPPLDDDGNIPF